MYKRKDGLFEKKRTYGKETIHFYGRTEQDVYNQIYEYENLNKKRKNFDSIAKDWKNYYYPNIQPNTQSAYEPARKRAVKHFKNIPITDIKPAQIQEFINDFSKKGYKKQTVHTQLLVIRLICRFAVLENYLSNNIASEIKIPKNLEKTKRTPPIKKDIDIIRNNVDKPFGLFPFFILYTGMRPGELKALYWEDIDFDNRLICVNKAISTEEDGNTPFLKETKTSNGVREIPLLDPLYNVIIKYKSHGLIFKSKNGTYLSKTGYRRRWERYKKITQINCTAYQLRHQFCTMLYEAGIKDKDAQNIMGHSSIVITRDIYTTISNEQKNKSFNQINQYVKNIQ